jgi:hypothetical protein
MSHTNRSTSRNNSIINPVGQSSVLTRGPSPSLNNIREEEPQSLTPTNVNRSSLFVKSNDDITSILKRIETTLNRTNERLDLHEKELNSIRNNHRKTEHKSFDLISPYINYILIIIVAIILKYIFR